MRVEIILPKRATSKIEKGLTELTKYIVDELSLDTSYGLGGEYGYGVEYENDIFMMHPFCWCDKKSCKWCHKEYPNFIYKPTDTRIWWYKWIGRDTKILRGLPKDWLDRCKESIKESKEYVYFKRLDKMNDDAINNEYENPVSEDSSLA